MGHVNYALSCPREIDSYFAQDRMKNHRIPIALMLWLCLTAILLPARAHAYLDPGTGGLLYQMGFAVFSLVLGTLFLPLRFLKNLLSKIKNKIRPQAK